MWRHLVRRTRTAFGRSPAIWYDPAYRLPLATLESATGVEPRRADLAAWYLLQERIIRPEVLRQPEVITYSDLARVHTAELLESFDEPASLARIFTVEASGLPVAEVMRSVRLACGGTLAAARAALRARAPAMNLQGGFHHAGPGRAGGFCPVNDIAVALATLRAEGFGGRVAVVDLDAHPPDGTSECLAGDARAWIGSLSGSEWTPLEGVDETVLPPGTGDDAYLDALRGLLERMPPSDLVFVVAGGDVLAGDRFGRLGLTLAGARQRDLMVADAIEGSASVWLPAGGYSDGAWRVLAGTALVLCGRAEHRLRTADDPLRRRFAELSLALVREEIGEFRLTPEDLGAGAGGEAPATRLLGVYETSAVERAFERYGVTAHLARLGYGGLRFGIAPAGSGEGVRVFGRAGGREHLLIECVVERRTVDGAQVLWVGWLALRNPLAAGGEPGRPLLPGQDVPGLGMAREAGAMLAVVARGLGLAGVGFRPAWYHTAHAARHLFRFVDPARQARFEALARVLSGMSLREASMAVNEGRVLMNGEPYVWEADDMVFWLPRHRAAHVAPVPKSDARFEIVPSSPHD